MKHEHNMWSYIYYSIYLDQIDASDRNAIDHYVHKMVSKYYIHNVKYCHLSTIPCLILYGKRTCSQICKWFELTLEFSLNSVYIADL